MRKPSIDCDLPVHLFGFRQIWEGARPAGVSNMMIRLVANLVAGVLCAALPVWAASGQDAGDVELEASIQRARPAVALISSEVSAEASIDCGTGPARAVRPDPHVETGSGFVIHPDGYVATNGHVVAASYEKM